MRVIGDKEAQQRFGELLDAVERQTVVIRRNDRDVAALVSIEDFEQLRKCHVQKLDELCKEVSEEAKARGLNAQFLEEILRDEG